MPPQEDPVAAAIERAKARVEATSVPIYLEAAGEQFELRTIPELMADSLRFIDSINAARQVFKETGDETALRGGDIVGFLESHLTDESVDLVGQLSRKKIVKIRELLGLYDAIQKAVAGRPPTKSGHYTASSDNGGPTLTGGAPPDPSTGLPSPLIDSST